MPLDMFQQDQADQIARVQTHNEPRLPAEFGEGFAAAWSNNQLFEQSTKRENARQSALSDITDDLYRKTGNPAFHPAVVGGDLDGLNASIRLANQKDNAGLDEISADQLAQRGLEKSKAAHTELADVQGREQTLGGKIGMLAGSALGTATDPVNLVVAPLAAPEGLGLLGTALAWGAIGGGTQAAIEAIDPGYRDMVQPSYSQSGEPARNILGAAAGGAAIGGTLKGLGMAWTRAKTGEWPRSIRDAGNVVESEQHTAQSNVLPGIDGEVAHREALAKTIDDVVAGRKVEVPDAVTAPPEPKPGFDVFHGSPHDFDRFSMEKIGTGEGAQSYGHGLYFAENEGVADSYRNAGALEKTLSEAQPEDRALIAKIFREAQTPEEAAQILETDATAAQQTRLTKLLESQKTNLYRVRINADREAMLDYDKPLSEQSEHVKKSLKAIGLDDATIGNIVDRPHGYRLTGEHVQEALEEELSRGELRPLRGENTDKAVSRILHEAGIPGIKYLDQGSRGAGDGSRNIVLFDDKLAQITHKNGEPLSLFDQHEARVDMAMDERAGAKAAEARAAPSKEVAPELPFEATKEQALGRAHTDMIADGVASIARQAGYEMPREEAERIAQMVNKASTDEQARAILSTVADRPQTVADYPPTPLTKSREGELPAAPEPKVVEQTVGTPEHDAALRADIDRARATGDVKIPAGVDEKGEPIMRSVDAAMDEVDAYKAAAEQIQACANPQPETEKGA